MIQFFLILSLASIVIVSCGFIIGTMADDFKDIRRRHLFSKRPYSRPFRSRPLVTVLLIASNDVEHTKEALRRIKKNPYQRLEIIIVGNTRSRAKLKILTSPSKKPAHPIYIFTGKKSEQSNADAAYHRYGHGDIVLVLHDTDQLQEEAIKRSVWHFNTQKNISQLRARTAIVTRYSNIGTLQTYMDTLTYFWNKFKNSFEYTQKSDDPDVLFYRTHAFANRHISLRATTFSTEDIIVERPATTTRKLISHTHTTMRQQVAALLSLRHPANQNNDKSIALKGLLALFVTSAVYASIALPFLLSYFVFLALVPHQPVLLFVTMAILSIYILLGLWSHAGISRLRKIRLSIFIPAYFIPFYMFTIMFSVVTIATVTRAIRVNLSKVTALRRKISLR
jgi:hypothetical protein